MTENNNLYFDTAIIDELISNGYINVDDKDKIKDIFVRNMYKFSVTYWCPEDVKNILELSDDPDIQDIILSNEECFEILEKFTSQYEIASEDYTLLENIVQEYVQEKLNNK